MPEAIPGTPSAASLAHVETQPDGSVRVNSELIPPKEETSASRPAGLPDKFKSWEEMATSYKALEQKLGTKEPQVTTPADASKVIEAAGLDLPSLYAEFAKNDGKLSDASLAKLEKQGVSKEAVALHIKGMQAIAEKQTTDLAEAVGGKDALTKVLEWASTALTPSEKDAYNAAIDSGNTDAAKLLLKSIKSAYTQANGEDPKFTSNGEPVSTPGGIAGFGSTQEMVAAMRDVRYKNGDKAYHAKVAAQLKNTTAF